MKKSKGRAITKFVFLVDGRQIAILASQKEIAFEIIKKQYPLAKIKDVVK